MSFYSWLVNSLRNRRYSYANASPLATRLYTFGAIYQGVYKNWKHDPNPVVWIQFSDAMHTHVINLNYLSNDEKAWFVKTVYLIKKYQQQIDGRTFYNLIKQQKISIIKKAYRIYFTNMFDGKLVGAGITNMEKLCYSTNNRFVTELNNTLTPQKITSIPTKVAYNSTELRDRIIEAQNTIPINQATVNTGITNRPVWLKK